MNNRWVRLSETFPDAGVRKLVALWMPRLRVDSVAILNRPTRDDPLGQRPRLTLVYRHTEGMGNYEAQVRLDDSESPFLTPPALQVWLCVEHPTVFRVEST